MTKSSEKKTSFLRKSSKARLAWTVVGVPATLILTKPSTTGRIVGLAIAIAPEIVLLTAAAIAVASLVVV